MAEFEAGVGPDQQLVRLGAIQYLVCVFVRQPADGEEFVGVEGKAEYGYRFKGETLSRGQSGEDECACGDRVQIAAGAHELANRKWDSRRGDPHGIDESVICIRLALSDQPGG